MKVTQLSENKFETKPEALKANQEDREDMQCKRRRENASIQSRKLDDIKG